ncbi:MAG: hypothetical protein M3N97_06960 [Pseudomonadota bacterium]|nr:hypothetical protein [Pseudomonadota bacterium]
MAVKRAWLAAALAMAAMLSARGASRSLDGLIESVVRRGADAVLPARLSVVLGVTGVERTTAVKQAVIRDRSAIRTFNVCATNPDDVVILTYDEQSRSTKAYLLSAKGALRKAVNYQAGAPANVRSLAEARSDFAAEIGFWTDFEHQRAVTK